MISLKGPGLKIFADILAVIALAFGAYSTFFRSEGFVDGTATIISIEEDAEEHKVASKLPAQGFYRVHTREKNLDLLFIILVAMARSGATDERGGSRRMLFNTISDK